MGRLSRSYYLMVWIGIGAVAATLGANRLFASGLVDYEVLYGYVSRGWDTVLQNRFWLGVRVAAVRLAETAVIVFVCRRGGPRARRIGVCLLLVLMGAVTGLSVVLMTWCRGVFGIVCAVVTCLPHYLFYLGGWGIVLVQALSGYEIRRGRFWGAIVLLVTAGILSEIWLNPFFLSLV